MFTAVHYSCTASWAADSSPSPRSMAAGRWC